MLSNKTASVFPRNDASYKFQFLLAFSLPLNVIAKSCYCLKIVPVS